MNAAFMAKLKWDLAMSKQKTWAAFFIHKYNYLNPTKRANTSYIYKILFKEKKNLC